jgi:acyl-CoA thioester hydrolase
MKNKNGDVIEIELRVRYAETDGMNIVHHSNYIIWFEAARSEYLIRKGSSYTELLEKQGFHLPVSEVYARFLKPARYPEMVKVKTWVEELRSRKLTFGYEVVNSDTGEILATGYSRHICTDLEGRVRAIPPRVRDFMA